MGLGFTDIFVPKGGMFFDEGAHQGDTGGVLEDFEGDAMA